MKRAILIAAAVLLTALMATAATTQAHPQEKVKTGATESHKVTVYYCAKCEHVQGTAGKCEKCGGPVKAVDADDLEWVCDMCKVTSTHPGKCPECGMEMKPKIKTPDKPPAK